MPWQHCNNDFNTPSCISMEDIKRECKLGVGKAAANYSTRVDCSKLSNRTSPTEEFFK